MRSNAKHGEYIVGCPKETPPESAFIKFWIKFVPEEYQRIVKTYFKEIART